MMRIISVALLMILSSVNVLACSCSFAWNDSFSRTIKESDFVALVQVISFDEYLEDEILGYDRNMPYIMTVEIIKKYKGEEQRRKIKILGDDGALCRPYLSNFEINGYYLISPAPLDNSADTDYDFFVCRTEYLKVDIDSNKAYGKYSIFRKQIDLEWFDRKFEKGGKGLVIFGSTGSMLFLLLMIVGRGIKRNTNNVQVVHTSVMLK